MPSCNDPFPRVDFDDGVPATRRDLIGFWALIAGCSALWCGALIWVGFAIATWPVGAQSSGILILGMLIGAAIAGVALACRINPIRSDDA
jgi:hypothetical protein